MVSPALPPATRVQNVTRVPTAKCRTRRPAVCRRRLVPTPDPVTNKSAVPWSARAVVLRALAAAAAAARDAAVAAAFSASGVTGFTAAGGAAATEAPGSSWRAAAPRVPEEEPRYGLQMQTRQVDGRLREGSGASSFGKRLRFARLARPSGSRPLSAAVGSAVVSSALRPKAAERRTRALLSVNRTLASARESRHRALCCAPGRQPVQLQRSAPRPPGDV